MAGLVSGAKAPDSFLIGISRAPITVTLPGNMAAAFRAGAYFYEVSPYEEIFESLRAGAELALGECGREDAPGVGEDRAWIMESVDISARPLAPAFTDAQRSRLEEAARILARATRRDVTIEELIVAGAMHLLDGDACTMAQNVESVGAAVEIYTRRKMDYAHPEHGKRDPFQSCEEAAA